jgi:surface polysaccharide O-acyltransferase-like enzyme
VTSKRILGIDFIKVFSMFGVLFLHTLLAFTKRPDLIHTKLWWFLEPLAIVATFAVPLFFMVSGYLATGKKSNIKTNLKNNIFRLGIPLLTFIFLQAIYLYAFRYHLYFTFPQVIGNSFLSVMSSQLWFLVYLLIFRLFNPLWELLFQKNNKGVGLYLALVLMVLIFVTSLGNHGSGGQGTFFSFLSALYFYLLGGIFKLNWISKISKIKLLIIGLALVMIFLADYLTLHLEYKISILPIINVMLGLLSVPCVFMLLLQAKTLPFAKIITYLATMSFGVYLWQEIVVMFRMDVLGFEYDFVGLNPYLYCILNFAFVFGVSLGLTHVMSLIPKIKKLVGFR